LRTARRVPCLPLLAALAAAAGAAGAAPALPPLPAWSSSVAVESAVGYKDNLLLSAAGEERSSFLRGSAELLIMRVPSGSFEYSSFAQAEGTRFLQGRTVRNEARVWLRNEAGWRPGPQWELHLPVTGYYDDKVFDQSDTELERLTAVLRVFGAVAGPALRWDFHRSAWLEAETSGQREKFADHGNDAWTRHASIRVSVAPLPGLEAGVGLNSRWRDFDFRSQYSAAGRILPGTLLRTREDEADLRVVFRRNGVSPWQVALRAGLLDYRDNGSGYFDRREIQLEPEFSWRPSGWELRLRGAARRVEFGVQTVGVGLNPAPRIRDEHEVDLRVERRMRAGWSVFASFRWERARSNERIASYVVNEGLLGLRRSWEK
jgi:hypothetical protein